MPSSLSGPFPAHPGCLVWRGAGDTADPGNTNSWATNVACEADTGLTLTKPIPIVPQINFSVQLTWPAAITLAGGDTAVQVIVDGTVVRPVQ